MEKVPNIAFQFELKSVINVTKKISENPGISLSKLSEYTLLPEPKAEAYRNWAYFIGLINKRENAKYEVSEFGKRSNSLLNPKNKKFFFELAHLFLMKRNQIASAIISDGFRKLSKVTIKSFTKKELIEAISPELPFDKSKVNFLSYFNNIFKSLINTRELGSLRIITTLDEDKFSFSNYDLTIKGFYFFIANEFIERKNSGHSSSFLSLNRIYSDSDSALNTYACSYTQIAELVENLRIEKIAIVETVSDLNQITFFTKIESISDLFNYIEVKF